MQTYSKKVVQRMFNVAELEAFETKYRDNLIKTGASVRKVTPLDIEIFNEYKAGATIGQLRTKHGLSDAKVRTSIVLGLKG